MKKKVAILANGCNYEILHKFENALYSFSGSMNVDFFNFLWNATEAYDDHNDSKGVIFRLPNLKDFDAIVLFNPGLNLGGEIDYVYTKAAVAHVPVISIGMEYPGFTYIGIDNYSGMKELCNHLIKEHGVKTLHLIAGSMDNEDSNLRVRAVWDALNENGIGIDPNHVFYTDWQTSAAAGYIERLIESGDDLPDAFVCANDYLAEMVAYVLSTHGISVPGDCIVTGFDYNEEGRLFSPSIASIDQQYDLIGKKTAKLLSDIFGGEPVESSSMIDCIFMSEESCGCGGRKDNDSLRRDYTSSLLLKRRNKMALDALSYSIQKILIEAENYNDLIMRLRKNFLNQSGYEGNTFYLLLDPELNKLSERGTVEFPKGKHADKMTVVVGKCDGKDLKIDSIDSSELIPAYSGEGPNHVYYFIPIYLGSYACGYAVFCDKNDWVLEHSFVAFEDSFSKTLELYKRNIQLTTLNNTLSKILKDKI